jgi:uncharacterized protein (DUF1800 family)
MASLLPLSGNLGKRLAKHLLRRATYNISKARIEEFSNYTVSQAMAKLLDFPAKKLTQPIHYDTGAPWINDDPIYGAVDNSHGSGQVKLNNYLAGWWMDEAKRDTSLRAKMTYFLFTDFTTSIRTLNNEFHYDYLMLLEFFCVGDWKEFVYQMTKNNVMLKYLNNNENINTNPNENFAREILELFTIGKGPQVAIGDYTNYTESDIEEAARALTGWNYTKNNRGDYDSGDAFGNIPCGYAIPNKHDFGKKEFSNRFNNHVIEAWDTTGKTEAEKIERIHAELKEFIVMVLDQAETAKFICRKLYRAFVSRNITQEIEDDIIVPLASTFRAHYNLEETITQLFQSQHFYDKDDSNNSDEIIGGLIKSPLDLTLQSLSITDYPVPDAITDGRNHYLKFYYHGLGNKVLTASGQDIFRPPSVAGFPPTYEAPDYDKFWFNTSTIIPRYDLANLLLDKNTLKATFNISEFVRNNVSDPTKPETLVSELASIFFPEDIDAARINYFATEILLEGGSISPITWANEWTTDNMNPNSGIEEALKPLFRAFIWAQEFQTN